MAPCKDTALSDGVLAAELFRRGRQRLPRVDQHGFGALWSVYALLEGDVRSACVRPPV